MGATVKLSDYLAAVADAYLRHPHEPDASTVACAYRALSSELLQQYAILSRGIAIEHTADNPYTPISCDCRDCAVCHGLRVICDSCGMCSRCHSHAVGCNGCRRQSASSAMFADIDRRKLRVFRGASIPQSHPMAHRLDSREANIACALLTPTPIAPVTINDIFRAVHDGLAHYPGRHSFGMIGEFKAYKAHTLFLSPLARWAVATETLAQSACYYRGPNPGVYAPQKATLLPLGLIEMTVEVE